ncbi:MAG: hypothetical protein NTY90_01775 [Candidatus Micrarchaeota archaeon]|nr:hypothetical protein [Candidatus Micrarchaeota archaeon]
MEKEKPWNAGKLAATEKLYTHVFVDRKGTTFLKDLGGGEFHSLQFRFPVSEYENEMAAREHAVQMARFHRLLAEKKYFHPDTVFGIYSEGKGQDRQYRLFTVMPRLEIVKSVKETRVPVQKLAGFLKRHGLMGELHDIFESRSGLRGQAYNFGKDAEGKVYAVDAGLWAYKIPSAEALKQAISGERSAATPEPVKDRSGGSGLKKLFSRIRRAVTSK